MLYLDNSATTKIKDEVFEEMLPYLKEEYGNPSSKYYTLAENAKKAVDLARERVANLVNCEPDEVIFTSGATESNNMVLKGVTDYYGQEGSYIITSKVEHPSIIETCNYLKEKGFNTLFLDVDQFGRVESAQMQKMINEKKPIIVSIMWGNNEVGSLNPISEIAELCDRNHILFHTDATQVIGKVEVDLKKNPGIRFLSLSGHKINAPKGIGACIIRKEAGTLKTKITPLLHGGEQEEGYRSGTLAVHNIVGLGKAAEIAKKNQAINNKKLIELEEYLKKILIDKFGERIKFNNDHSDKIPGILSVQFVGINNELLVKRLAKYICLSTGSACSSSKPSHVLEAMGKPKSVIRETVRISLSPDIQKEELDIFKQL